MSQDSPFDFSNPRNTLDMMDKLNNIEIAAEAGKTRRLLEEQVRLQKEANALEKRRLDQEQERLKLEREKFERQK